MKSPFPGMDPFLESHWGDLHARLVVYACDQLRSHVPGDLKVRVEEHVSVQFPDGDESPRGYYPDVGVIEHSATSSPASATAHASAVAEPLLVPMSLEHETRRWIEIIDSRS